MGLIGAAVGAASSIYGGIKASKAMNQVKENLNNQLKDNQNWYDKNYNEDATQRSDAQAILTKTEDSIKNRNQQAAGTQAVMGGTDESTAATKEANNKALADATSNIAVNADQRKDNIEQQYLSTKSNLNSQLNNLQMQKAQNITTATQGVANAAGGMSFGNAGKIAL